MRYAARRCLYLFCNMIAVQQNQYQLESPLYDSTAFIPANYNYLNIELSSDQHPQDPPHHFIAPFIDHSLTFGQILKGLLENTHLSERYPLQKLRLTLKGGYKLEMQHSLEKVRLMLCRQSASGMTVRAEAIFWEIENNAAMTFHIFKETDFHHGQINKYFLLLNNQEPFCIAIRKSIPLHQLQNAICFALNEQYHNKVQQKQLKFFRIRKSTEEVIFAWDKVEELEGSEVCGRILEAEHEMVGVQAVMVGGKWPTVQVQSEEYLIFHIDSTHKIKLKFALIAKYRVGQLLQHLRFEHSNSLGIKIVDEIFPPWQQLQKAEKYFRTGEGNFVKNVQCRLVSEREMFYAAMGTMEPFPITKQMVTQAKEGLYEKCRDLAQRRIDELSKSNESIFSSADQIHPIALYTSSVDIIDKQAKSSSLLYRSLNDHLRNGRFGLENDARSEWRYKFSATLIKSLQKIHPFQEISAKTNAVTVYRGIRGHQLQGEVGDLYVAKEFVSSSADQAKARKFASNASIGTVLEIECRTGRPISQYSVYEKEQEILFMPYTYFRIVEKDTSSSIFYIKLKELPQHQYSSNPATEIVWVDDKLREGEKVITSLNCPMHTTFLHQLTSTSSLKEWITRNKNVILNPTIRVALITNMRRRQNGQEVVDAGAKTVELVRRQIPKAEIILYIYHVEGTKAQLHNNGIDPDTVTIFNKRAQLRDFIASCCAPLEEKEKEQVILETIKSVLKAFAPESHNSSQKEEA